MADSQLSRDESVSSVLTELLRLYDWRNEIGRIERDFNHDRKQVKTWLNQYGREKKAAWEAARRVLSAGSENGAPQPSTAEDTPGPSREGLGQGDAGARSTDKKERADKKYRDNVRKQLYAFGLEGLLHLGDPFNIRQCLLDALDSAPSAGRTLQTVEGEKTMEQAQSYIYSLEHSLAQSAIAPHEWTWSLEQPDTSGQCWIETWDETKLELGVMRFTVGDMLPANVACWRYTSPPRRSDRGGA